MLEYIALGVILLLVLAAGVCRFARTIAPDVGDPHEYCADEPQDRHE